MLWCLFQSHFLCRPLNDHSGFALLQALEALHPLRHLTLLARLGLNSCFLKDFPEEISHLQALNALDFAYNMEISKMVRRGVIGHWCAWLHFLLGYK